MVDDTLNVLVVGDDPAHIQHLRDVLSQAQSSHLVLIDASDFEQAQHHVAAQQISLLLLDMSYAVADATLWEFIRLMAPSVPVVALSTVTTEQRAYAALRVGAYDYLPSDQISAYVLERIARYASERQRMQRDLHTALHAQHSSEARLHSILNQQVDAILIIDNQGMVRFANHAAAHLFERRRDEMVGQTFGLPILNNHPTEIDIIRQNRAPAVAQMYVVPTEWEGEQSALIELHDVTDYISTQERLSDLEQFNRAILNSLPTHIAVLNEQGTIVAVNDAWMAFAQANGDIDLQHTGVGINYFNVCQNASENTPDVQSVVEGMRAVLDGQLPLFELEYPCDSLTQERWFLMRVMPLVGQSSRQLVVSHSDITERKRLARLEAEARAQAERLREYEREILSFEHLLPGKVTTVTARMFGVAPLREEHATIFEELVERYGEILDLALNQRAFKIDHDVSEDLRTLTDQLGFLHVGPRDVVEIHLTALKRKSANMSLLKTQAYVEEGRVIVLELMGHLVSFYRNYYLGFRQLVHANTPPSQPVT